MHESKQGARTRRWLPWAALVGALGGSAGRGPAAQAGLRAEDIIIKVNGQAATSNVQLQELTLTKKPGDQVPVEYWRNGHTATTAVTLGTQP